MKYAVTVVKFSGKRVVHTVEAERFEETGRKRRVFYDAEGRPVAEFQHVESVTSSPEGTS
jgi:hypothetical protein